MSENEVDYKSLLCVVRSVERNSLVFKGFRFNSQWELCVFKPLNP